MKVVVIEDEKPAARRLGRMLNELGIAPLAMLHSVVEAVDWFQNNEHPDLLFLDIQLSDGLSFEIFETIEIKSAIIFTTAYDAYALKAFKLNSVDYLLKPIDADELTTAIDKYKNTQSLSATPFDIEQIKALVNPAQKAYKTRFTVKVGQHLKMIPTADIECFFSENKATYICTNKGRNYLVDETLEHLESKLPNHLFLE